MEACVRCERGITPAEDVLVRSVCGCLWHYHCYHVATVSHVWCARHQQRPPARQGAHTMHPNQFLTDLHHGRRSVEFDHATARWNDRLDTVAAAPQSFDTRSILYRRLADMTRVQAGADDPLRHKFQKRAVTPSAEVQRRFRIIASQDLRQLLLDCGGETRTVQARCGGGVAPTPLDFAAQEITARDFLDANHTLLDLSVYGYTWHDFVALRPAAEDVRMFGVDEVLSLYFSASTRRSDIDGQWFRSFFLELCGGNVAYLLALRLTLRNLEQLNIRAQDLMLLKGFDMRRHLPLFPQVSMRDWHDKLRMDRQLLLTARPTQRTLTAHWRWTVDETLTRDFECMFDVTLTEDFDLRDDLDS